MKLPRSSTLKAVMTAAVYAVVGLTFFEEYPAVGTMFWGLSIFRLLLYYRELKRYKSLPETDRAAGRLDTPEGPD